MSDPKRTTRMMGWLEYRVRVTTNDQRVLVGTLLAFDKYLNLVLGECEEFRRVKIKIDQQKIDALKKQTLQQSGGSAKVEDIPTFQEREAKRTIGLTLLRGENVTSVTAEAPPAKMVAGVGAQGSIQPGPGRAAAAGRGGGAVTSGSGLSGAVRGVGGPGGREMMPRK